MRKTPTTSLVGAIERRVPRSDSVVMIIAVQRVVFLTKKIEVEMLLISWIHDPAAYPGDLRSQGIKTSNFKIGGPTYDDHDHDHRS